MKPVFTWSDAWVLGAVALGGGEHGAGLKEIIEAGDLINRAIFTPRQLRLGLAKLIHAGHVSAVAGQYAVVGDALLAARRLAYQNPSSYDLLQCFEDFLEAAPYGTQEPEEDDAQWPLPEVTDESVAAASAAHRAEYAALHKDAGGPKRS